MGSFFFGFFLREGAQEGSYRAGERARLTSSVDNTVETEPTNLWGFGVIRYFQRYSCG